MKKKSTQRPKHLRQSKSDDFLEKIRTHNPMIEYFTRLTVMNPAAEVQSDPSFEKRNGSYVRLAHAREEFPAPKISKGKSVQTPPRRKKSA